MNTERYLRLRQVLDQRQTSFSLITDGVHKAQNLSAIVRTCDAVGMHRVHMVQPDYEKFKLYKKTAGGSMTYVERDIHDTALDAIETVRSEGKRLIVTHLSPDAQDYRHVDYTQDCAIVVGAEKFGVSQAAIEAADEHIVIPMQGLVESLNVSVATALILFEAQRQKIAAGHYQHCGLSDDEYHQVIFRWTHPRIAEYCERKQLPFPAIDQDTGHLLDGKSWYDLHHVRD